MRTDKLIYLLLQLAPHGFFSLLGRNPDDAAHYEFKSVELKEIAFRIDGIFVPNTDDVTYFVEAQFQTDEQFYARLFAEIFLYLKQYPTKKWQAVVIYPSRTIEQKTIEPYADLLALERVKRVYLDELPESESTVVELYELLITPKEKVEARARKIAQRANPLELDLLVKILSYKNLTRERIRNMLAIEKDLFKETVFYKEVFEEGMLKGKQEGKLEGKQEGKLEGKQEGERAGKLSTVPLLRELGLSDEQIAEKLQLPVADVRSVM
ncbi:MAG: Rpn family recombination-promoting nuclease/putative transposase [Chloroherpetonaceae bacterium]